MISFGQSFTQYSPHTFPYSTYNLVAPFWDDIDLSSTGAVYYEVITPDNGLNIINQVDTYLSNIQSISFSADWILVAKWLNVCPFGNSLCSNIQVNYFILIESIIVYSVKHISSSDSISWFIVLYCFYLSM